MNALDAALNFHQSSLRVRAQRQELLAANIANADTPNYKARDIDFNQAMADALNGNVTDNSALTNTNVQHLAGNTLENSLSQALYRKEVQSSADGNTVDMDVERNHFTDNALRYEASLTMLNAKIKGLMTAIQG